MLKTGDQPPIIIFQFKKSRSMKTFITVLLFTATLGLVSMEASTPLPTSSDANPPRWEKLGARKVNYGLDHDEVLVTVREGRFSAVKLRVLKGGVHMHKMVIHFGDGTRQNVDLRNKIPAGGETRVINLKGNKKRVIRRVEFWYDTKGFARGRATVQLWGRH